MIIRTAHYDRFTVVPNDVINDHTLTWKARGLLIHLLAKPEGWATSASRLAKTGPDGRDAVRSGLAELEQHGYLVRRREQNAAGHWQTITWVYDCRQTVRNSTTGAGKSDVGKSGAITNTDLSNTEGVSPSVPTGAACPLCAGWGRTQHESEVQRCPLCNGRGLDPT